MIQARPKTRTRPRGLKLQSNTARQNHHSGTAAVPLSALQTLEGKDVVFVRDGDAYQAREVQLGARDARQVAVIGGLRAGEQVAIIRARVRT